MKTTAKKQILLTPGIERGEIRIKGVRFGEVVTFPFSSIKNPDRSYPTIDLLQGKCYGESIWLQCYVDEKGLELVTSIMSASDRRYNPLYLQTFIPWKNIEILWWMKSCITEPLSVAA